MIRTLAFLLALLPAACVSPPPAVPATYTGPVARIQDSVGGGGMTHAHVFYLAAIDGRQVEHSGTEITGVKPILREWPFVWTADMNVNVTGRLVPARPATFRIAGRTNYTTLFGEMFSPTNEITGEIAFTPQADELYSVRGVIGDSYSAVWIADSTGTPVGPRIERGQRPQ